MEGTGGGYTAKMVCRKCWHQCSRFTMAFLRSARQISRVQTSVVYGNTVTVLSRLQRKPNGVLDVKASNALYGSL